MNSETQVEHISCEQMKVLAQSELLPVTQSEKDALREALAQIVSNSLSLGTISTPMSYCDY